MKTLISALLLIVCTSSVASANSIIKSQNIKGDVKSVIVQGCGLQVVDGTVEGVLTVFESDVATDVSVSVVLNDYEETRLYSFSGRASKDSDVIKLQGLNDRKATITKDLKQIEIIDIFPYLSSLGCRAIVDIK